MTSLAKRVETLERRTAQRRGQGRCATCREWPSNRWVVTEINVDGVEARHDELEEPVGCPGCGWSPTVYEVEVLTVRDWDSVGKHGRV